MVMLLIEDVVMNTNDERPSVAASTIFEPAVVVGLLPTIYIAM
jgi:hypothetical protein